MGGGGGHNLWFYTSTDALSAERASGYFNDALVVHDECGKMLFSYMITMLKLYLHISCFICTATVY